MTLNMKKILVVALVIVIGAISLFSSVAKKKTLIDQDEAACIFSGYYLELYKAGRWDDPVWREFMEYAEHPPGGGYLYGLMLNAIGKPMKTVEPRRYWFHHSLDPTYYPNKFFEGLKDRYSMEQVVAGRHMSAVIALLTAITVMLMLFRLVGYFEGIAGFVLLMIHPAFVFVGTIATFDIFIIFLSVLTIFLTTEIQGDEKRSLGGIVSIGLCASITLGIALVSKISSYALIPAMFICVAILSRGRGHLLRGICSILGIFIVASLISYVLDPASYGDPIGTLFERIAWRMDRVEIQQITSPAYDLPSHIDRIKYGLYKLFFSGTNTLLGFVFFICGLLSVFILNVRRRERFVILGLTIYFMILMLAFLPLAWMRYISSYVPFVILMEGLGAGFILYLSRNWRGFTKRIRILFLTTLFVTVSAGNLAVGWFGFNHLSAPNSEDLSLAPAFGYSISQPGKDVKLHRFLYDHFKRIGNEKRAEFQLKQLEKMKVKP